MTDKTVAEKAHVKPGVTVAVVRGEPGIVESLGLPAATPFVEPERADLVFLFVRTNADLDADMPPLVEQLAPGSALWVFFRKGSKDAGLDVNRDDIWALAEQLAMRPLGLIGVDDAWSAFRLRNS